MQLLLYLLVYINIPYLASLSGSVVDYVIPAGLTLFGDAPDDCKPLL